MGGLIALLCALGVVIAGLVAGIILMGEGKQAEETPEVSEEQIAADKYVSYVEDYYSVRNRVSELFDSGSVSADKIIEIYSVNINDSIASGEYSRANSYILAEYEDLLRGDFVREALDVLISTDLTFLSESEQHRWYYYIIALAEELGDEGVIQKYEPLLLATEAAWEADNAASAAAAVEFGVSAQEGNEE